jgi:hypothetical protein
MLRPLPSAIRAARRAAVFLWIAARVISASGLPDQSGNHYTAWKPESAAASLASRPIKAFAPAAAVETLKSALLGGGDKGEPPVELWLGARHWPANLPHRRQGDRQQGALASTWLLLSLAAAMLASVDSRHHRRRTHTGCRRIAKPFAPTKKPRPAF